MTTIRTPLPTDKGPVLPAAKTETAPWRVKGDGIAYTTSREIVESRAWQRSFSAARKIKLK